MWWRSRRWRARRAERYGRIVSTARKNGLAYKPFLRSVTSESVSVAHETRLHFTTHHGIAPA